MKLPFSKIASRCCWASLFAGSAVLAADSTNTPPAQADSTNAPATKAESPKPEPVLKPEEYFEGGAKTYNNWVEFSGGEFFYNGNKPQFQQQQKTANRGFGGLEDLHYST